MGENHTIGNIMGITMDKLKEMVDVNTIIGDPIQLQDGTAIIPISKVSFGFASGGSDLPSKNVKDLLAEAQAQEYPFSLWLLWWFTKERLSLCRCR